MADSTRDRRDQTPEEKRAFVEWFRKHEEDYLWCLRQQEILERHPGQVVVLHNRVILGSGLDSAAAKEDACRRAEAGGGELPAPHELLFVFIPANSTPLSLAPT